MEDHLSKLAYDPESGYAIKQVPAHLFSVLDNLVSSHLGLKSTIGSHAPSDGEILINALSQCNLGSRHSRTLPEDACRLISPTIIEQLSMIMPKPKRLHNLDIYFRVVLASDKNSISIPHRDEYFHRITPGWDFQKDEECVKVWIPLFSPSGRAIGIIPGSHKDYSHGNATYLSKSSSFQFDAPHQTSDLTPVKVAVNQCLVFPSMLIHGSLSLKALDPLRISVEISPVLSK